MSRLSRLGWLLSLGLLCLCCRASRGRLCRLSRLRWLLSLCLLCLPEFPGFPGNFCLLYLAEST